MDKAIKAAKILNAGRSIDIYMTKLLSEIEEEGHDTAREARLTYIHLITQLAQLTYDTRN